MILLLLAVISVSVHECARPARPWSPRTKASTYIERPGPFPVPAFFKSWRQRFLDSNAPNDSQGLVRCIFLGDFSAVPPNVREDFRQAGLYHLLSANGYNCWIISAIFAMLASLLLHFAFPYLPSARALRLRCWVHPTSRLFGTWLFWLWTNQSVPITRAVLMISTKFFLDLLGIATSLLRLLFIQYLLSLTIMPRLWRSASFQLTFGCLFGILLFPQLVEKVAPILKEKLPRFLWNYIVVSLGACLGCIPTTWIVFGEINFNSLLTNWFAVPPVSFVIMPLGLLQMMLLMPTQSEWLHGLAQHIGMINAYCVKALYTVLHAYIDVAPALRYDD